MSDITTVRSIHLPDWVTTISGYSALISTFIIFGSILCHLFNYRKPFEQRLMIRIQLIVPLFALSCFSMLVDPEAVINKFVIEPLREIYEAFVIYTFFSLLTDMLGGERNIIIMSSGREPIPHPGLVHYILNDIDISDPSQFLSIKRGVLQYVWLKPVICFSMLFGEVFGLYDVNDMGIGSLYLWLMILYNFSVTLSLYSLAIFWKVLWNDLKPFKPVGKFLCVKLIIFASYWQGIILAILNLLNVLPGALQEEGGAPNIGVSIQNALLCVELIGFSIGHWFSFSYKPFTISNLPTGRLQFIYALKDMFGVKDLINDFKLTFYGDYYKDYKQFDSVEALVAHPDSKGRMSRINQGLRYHSDGKHKHWLPNPQQQQQQNNHLHQNFNTPSSIRSTSEINAVGSHNQSLPLFPSNNQFNTNSSIYSPSVKSMGTSTRGLYPQSPKTTPPDSPASGPTEPSLSITETLNRESNGEINYDDELLDEDEMYYQSSCSVINNYNLDQVEVKRLINYPIVDELIDGHVYGYKVKKLRADRMSKLSNEPILRRSSYESNRYGSVV